MGIDATVSVASKTEDDLARAGLHEYLDDSTTCPLLKIMVPDTEGNRCEVIVGPPVTESRSVVGRCTSGFPAYDPVSQVFE